MTDRQLDPGVRLSAAAPGFTLTDQSDKRVSLRSLRGKVVVLSFNDPKCTTVCPLTTTALLNAKKLLGPAAARVDLIGVGANPDATGVKWVRAYFRLMGSRTSGASSPAHCPGAGRSVWRAYGIEAAVIGGSVDHTPATYVIGPEGRKSGSTRPQWPIPALASSGTHRAERRRAPPGPAQAGRRGVARPADALRPAQAGHAATGGRRSRSPRTRFGSASPPLLRHLGDRGHRSEQTTRRPQPLPGGRQAPGASAARRDRRRRG